MQFSNTTNITKGIVQDIDFLCGTTSASYLVNDKVRNVNQALHDITQIIWSCQDKWFFDDSGRTDYPRLLVTLTNNQRDYRVAAISTVLNHIKRIEIKDKAGDWQKLSLIDWSEVGVAKNEYYEDEGMPLHYDLDAGYISLYPAPNSGSGGATLSSGMAVYFSRDAIEFTSASTTAAPGFATQFHRILSYAAAIDFEKSDPIRLQKFVRERDRLMDGLKKYYGSRAVENKNTLRPYSRRRWRQYL